MQIQPLTREPSSIHSLSSCFQNSLAGCRNEEGDRRNSMYRWYIDRVYSGEITRSCSQEETINTANRYYIRLQCYVYPQLLTQCLLQDYTGVVRPFEDILFDMPVENCLLAPLVTRYRPRLENPALAYLAAYNGCLLLNKGRTCFLACFAD